MHPGRPKSHPGSSSSQCPPRSLSWGRAAPPEHPGSSTHTEPILSGPEPSLGPEPKLKQDLLCRGLSSGPSPEECQEMMPALLWQRPESPVPGREGWSWAQSPQHPLSCRSWAPLAGTGGDHAAGGDISPSSRESRGFGKIRLDAGHHLPTGSPSV